MIKKLVLTIGLSAIAGLLLATAVCSPTPLYTPTYIVEDVQIEKGYGCPSGKCPQSAYDRVKKKWANGNPYKETWKFSWLGPRGDHNC